MKPTAAIAAAALALAGCASGPVPPEWQMNAHGALGNYVTAYLTGNTRVAALELARARSEIASTGRADLLGRAELTRCAAQVASLDFSDCTPFQPLAADAGAGERAYADFLAGRWTALDAARLPPQYRSLASAGGAGAAAANPLGGIQDPMSRLVAAGVLFRMGRLSPAGIAAATETASAQGWRRPLLAWLGVQARLAETDGDTEAAARLRRRIGIATGAATTGAAGPR